MVLDASVDCFEVLQLTGWFGMFETDRVVWGVSIYWLVCGVSVDEIV